jgi:hypothetical protein
MLADVGVHPEQLLQNDRHLRYSHECRLLRWNVRCEIGCEMRLVYPPVVIAVRLERLGRLRQGLFDRRTAFTFIESKCGNIDKRRNVWMIAGLRGSPEQRFYG